MIEGRIEDHRFWLDTGKNPAVHLKAEICVSFGDEPPVEALGIRACQRRALPGHLDPDARDAELDALGGLDGGPCHSGFACLRKGRWGVLAHITRELCSTPHPVPDQPPTGQDVRIPSLSARLWATRQKCSTGCSESPFSAAAMLGIL